MYVRQGVAGKRTFHISVLLNILYSEYACNQYILMISERMWIGKEKEESVSKLDIELNMDDIEVRGDRYL
jgi:hypothetical protein